jgi:hypothetical protein
MDEPFGILQDDGLIQPPLRAQLTGHLLTVVLTEQDIRWVARDQVHDTEDHQRDAQERRNDEQDPLDEVLTHAVYDLLSQVCSNFTSRPRM